MIKALITSHDPVCGMNIEVAGSLIFTTYHGLTYHFCSSQCLERFNDAPALYIGPQRIADIRPIPKRRKLRLVDASESDMQRACQRVGEMMGIDAIRAEKDCLIVNYDLRQATLAQIESVVTGNGLKLKQGFHSFRRDCWKFLESNELENVARPSTGACCNRPPPKIH